MGMKRYLFDLLYAFIVGLLSYISTLIITVLKCVNNKEIGYMILYMTTILLLIVVVYIAINRYSLVHSIIRYVLSIILYIVIMGINGNIGTMRFIYNLLDIDINRNFGVEIIILIIMIITGGYVIVIRTIGKLCNLINQGGRF